MELNFVKNGSGYVAEFKVSSTFALHVEGVVEGNVEVFVRSTEVGEHARVRDASPYPSFSKVYDFTFVLDKEAGDKYIRVECPNEPTMAAVISKGDITPIEVKPDTPAEPEIIEYHFEIPMVEENHDGDILGYMGQVDGDFSEIHSKILACVKENEVDGWMPQEAVAEKLNITVNENKVIGPIEWNPYDNMLTMKTDAPWFIGGGSDFNLTPTMVNFEHGV